MNGKKILKLMFSLDEFVIPSIIRVLYILSFLFIILYSLYDAFGDIRYSFRSFSWDIILMFLRLLALRISTEILYLWFAVYKALMEIRNFIKVKVDSDEKKAESYLQNLPYVFGFRDYWEAEIAFADGKNDIALEKIKKSFAQMARFTSRCIRLAGRIVRAEGKDDADRISLELDEYMLRLINAFLSGGDYLPHRQIFQKTSLLPGLISQNIKAGNTKRAKEHMTELLKTRDDFFDCMDNPSNKHCLMFIEGDLDGSWNTTKEKINERVANAEKFLKQI